MLTKRHIEILLAALKFFDEEMMPHGRDTARFYFDNPPDGELKSGELGELRNILRTSELWYAYCDVAAPQLVGPDSLTSVEEILQAGSSREYRVATVLLPAPN